MTKAFLFISTLLLIAASGCNMEPASYSGEISKMEDTLWKTFPTVNRLTIEVKTDFGSELEVTMGDAELFNATEEKRQEATRKTAAIARHIFGEEKTPGKGKVIFVEKETTHATKDDEQKIYDMPADVLK